MQAWAGKAVSRAVASALLLLLACCSANAPGQALMFIVAGQSNAVGMAPVPRTLTYPNEARMFAFGNDNTWHTPVREPLDSCVKQIDQVSCDPQAGAGFVLPMIDAILRARPNDQALVVPCARSGSSITEWQRDDRRDTLYGSCLYRARRAADEWAARTGLPPDRWTVVWWQGETDAMAGEVFRTTWMDRFNRLRSDMRKDLADHTSRLSWLLAVMRPDPPAGYPAWQKIRTYQVNARANDPLQDTQYFSAGWYGTGGVVYDASGLHATLSSYQTIGGGWAAAAFAKLPN